MKKDIFAISIIVLACFAGYWHICKPGEILYSPHSDIVAEHIGSLHIFPKVHEGEFFPFWRSDQFSGYPAFTNPQVPFTNPLYLPLYFLRQESVLSLIIIMHILTAGLILYFLGKMLGLSVISCLFMAAAGMFNFKLILALYAGWLPLIPAIVLMPLPFALVYKLLQKPSLKISLGLAASGAVCVLSGHFQFIYYIFIFVLLYVCWQSVILVKLGNWEHVKKCYKFLAVSAMLCLGLAAFKLAPFVLEIPEISRAGSSYKFFLSNHALSLKHLLTFLWPEALGTPLKNTYAGIELWEDAAYFGLIPLIFAFAGAVGGLIDLKKRSLTQYLVFCFLFSLVLCFDTPVLNLAYSILPGLSFFRIPGRFLFVTAFFGIILAGIGIETLVEYILKKRLIPTQILTTLILVVLLLITLEGSFYARRYLKTMPYKEVVPYTNYRSFFDSDNDLYRVAYMSRVAINYGWAAPMGLELITGYDSYNLKDYQDYFDILRLGFIQKPRSRVWADLNTITRLDLLNALNVKYIVTPAPLELPKNNFKPVKRFKDQQMFAFYRGFISGDIFIYQNLKNLPRAYWVTNVIKAENKSDMIQKLKNNQIHDTAFVLNARKSAEKFEHFKEHKTLIHYITNNHIKLRVSNKSAGFLVISEVYHPGWKAYIKPRHTQGELCGNIQLFQTNLCLMGLYVPAGAHLIEIKFRPVAWPLSLWISIFTLILFIIAILFEFRTGILYNHKGNE